MKWIWKWVKKIYNSFWIQIHILFLGWLYVMHRLALFWIKHFGWD